MRKILLCRLKGPLRPYNMLTVHKCSDTGLFRDLHNPAFCSLEFEKEIISETHLFFKVSQILCRYQKCSKKSEKFLTLAFTEREYLSSGVNMLTGSLKIYDTTKKEFF